MYHARDTATGAEVALKSLLSFEPTRIYDLKHEFRALAGFHHPHLVQLCELFVDEGDCFFTMELLHGPNFLDFVRGTTEPSAPAANGFDSDRLRDGLAQLCSGLAALHAKGTLHRDIKPSNVLVDRDERVVLLDFGLASDVESKLSRVSREHGLAGYPRLHGAGVTVEPNRHAGLGLVQRRDHAVRVPHRTAPPRSVRAQCAGAPPRLHATAACSAGCGNSRPSSMRWSRP